MFFILIHFAQNSSFQVTNKLISYMGQSIFFSLLFHFSYSCLFLCCLLVLPYYMVNKDEYMSLPHARTRHWDYFFNQAANFNKNMNE